MKHRMLPAAAGILLSTALCTCLVGCGKGNSSSLPDAPITTAVSAVTNAAVSTTVSTAQPDKPSNTTVATTAGAEKFSTQRTSSHAFGIQIINTVRRNSRSSLTL